MNKQTSESLPVRTIPQGKKWRRRRFLVDRRYQLTMAFLAVALVLALVILLNFSLFTSAIRETEEALSIAPEFEEYLRAQDRASSC